MAIAPDKPWSIYVLKDGRTGEIRYVGFTTKKLHQRLAAHIKDSRRSPGTYKCHWINQQMDQGIVPVIELIENGHGPDWVSREQYWIAHYRALNTRLTNVTDGGEGIPGLKLSDETRKRMSDAHINKPHSAEWVAKVALANRGKKRDPELVLRQRAEARTKTLVPRPIDALLQFRDEYFHLRGDRKKLPNGVASMLKNKYKLSHGTFQRITSGSHWFFQEKGESI